MKKQLFCTLLILSCSANAELFKWEDAEGNIIYSDQPPPGATKEETQVDESKLPAIITTPAVKPDITSATSLPEEQSEPLERYQSVAIVSPEHDTSIRQNAGNVSIKVAIEPYLFNERGDLLVVYMDNLEISRGRDTTIQLIEVDRGTHEVRAEIVDAQGSVVKKARPISFTLHRHSRLFNTN